MKRQAVKLSTILAFLLAVFSGGLLYLTSQEVQQAAGELARIEARLAGERERIRVLEAEWDYLNHPARLEALARRHLEMGEAGSGSVLADAKALPDPFMPALPAQKPDYTPVLKVRKASASASVSVSASASVSAARAPVRQVAARRARAVSPPVAGRAAKKPQSEAFAALLDSLDSGRGRR